MTAPSSAAVKKHLPSGPCLLCNDPSYNAAHRVIDAIRDQHRAGESIATLASEFEMPRAVVSYLAQSPIRDLDWLRRYWRKDAEKRMRGEVEGMGSEVSRG